jgi:hypothetical protein
MESENYYIVDDDKRMEIDEICGPYTEQGAMDDALKFAQRYTRTFLVLKAVKKVVPKVELKVEDLT